MKEKIQGSICLFATTLIWGSAFIAQSVGMDHIGPFTFQFFRCTLAILFLIPVSFLFEAGKCSFAESVRRWKDPVLWKNGFICGLALFAGQSLQQIGLVYTDAGKAGFITAMYIVLVPIIGLFLGKRLLMNDFISVALAVVGLYLLSCTGASGINIGDICLMGCALGFAAQITLVDRFAKDIDGFRLNCVQAVTVTTLSIPFMFATERVVMQDVLNCWLPLCYAGVMSMGVAYSLQIIGQKHLPPTEASLIMSLESVIAALCGWAFLKERMTILELTGCALVFIAVILSQLPMQKAEKVSA